MRSTWVLVLAVAGCTAANPAFDVPGAGGPDGTVADALDWAMAPPHTHGWIETVAPEQATGLLAKLYKAAIGSAGRVFNVIRIQSLHPEVLRVSTLLYREIKRDIDVAERGGVSDFDSDDEDASQGTRTTSLNLPIFAQESETGAAIPIDLGPKLSAVRSEDDPDGNGRFQQSIVVSGTAQNVKFEPQGVTPKRACEGRARGGVARLRNHVIPPPSESSCTSRALS